MDGDDLCILYDQFGKKKKSDVLPRFEFHEMQISVFSPLTVYIWCYEDSFLQSTAYSLLPLSSSESHAAVNKRS